MEDEDLTVIHSSTEANQKLFEKMSTYYRTINNILEQTLTGTIESDRKKLKTVKKDAQNSRKASKKIISTIFSVLQIPEISNDFEPSPRLIGSLNETSRHLCDLTTLCYDHFDNNHKELSDIQQKELLQVKKEITSMISQSIKVMQHHSDDSSVLPEKTSSSLQTTILNLNKLQLKRIKKGGTKTRQSLLYLGILSSLPGNILSNCGVSGWNQGVKRNCPSPGFCGRNIGRVNCYLKLKGYSTTV